MLHLILCLPLGAAAAAPTVTNAPLRQPDYEQFNREAAVGMKDAARTNLAPAYPYLAEYIVQRYRMENAAGIGLDIGGGPGNLAMELCLRTPRYYWINTDINTYHAEGLYRKALTNECAGRVGSVFADVHYLPFRDNYADFIVSRGSLPFWADVKVALAEIVRVLKPGGQAVIGRGFSPNLPLEVARRIRSNQGKGVPQYDPQETAEQLRTIMRDFQIQDFEIVRPRTDQTEVNYGVWLHFAKPGGRR